MGNQQDCLVLVAERHIVEKGPHLVHHLSIALALWGRSVDVLCTLSLRAGSGHPIQRLVVALSQPLVRDNQYVAVSKRDLSRLDRASQV